MKWKIPIILFIAFLLYNSVYFDKLDEKQARHQAQLFDAVTYARDFWDNRLPTILNDAVDIQMLLVLLQSDLEKAISQYGKQLGIGTTFYFLIKGRGRIVSIEDDQILVDTETLGSPNTLSFNTDFVFGNAIRDASGLVNVSQFTSTMEFNMVSGEINKIVLREVVKPFLEKVTEGDMVTFVGGCQLDQDDPDLSPLSFIPIRLDIQF